MHRAHTIPARSVVLALGLLLAFASPALAAPPSNDTYAGATAITAIPYSASLDTTEATTDADDDEANAQCGAPATDASVWYTLTLAEDTRVQIDTSASSYSTGVGVFTGAPGSLSVISCQPIGAVFDAAAGETYSILIFDDQLDGGGNGGTLELSIDVAPPAPTVDVTVDPVAAFNRETGGATLTGTVTCTGDTVDNFIELNLRQRVGRLIVEGFGFTGGFVCDGTTQTWSAEVFGFNGTFKGGKAAHFTAAFACNLFECGADFEEGTIQLRGR